MKMNGKFGVCLFVGLAAVSALEGVVSFPNVFSADGRNRAFDFEVVLEEREVDVVQVRKTKRVYSSGYYRGEKADEPIVSCPFARTDLPAANGKLEATRGRAYRFVVRPCDSFGQKGDPIRTEWIDS